MNRTLAWMCLFVMLAFPLASEAQDAKNSIGIDWRIEGRFRLIKDPQTGDALGQVALFSEEIRGGLKNGDPQDDKALKCFNKLENDEFKKTFVKNGGHMSFSSMPETYYNQETALYKAGYAHPKSWRIVLNATGIAGGDTCAWYKEGIPLEGKGNDNNCKEFAPGGDFGPDETTVELRVNNEARFYEKIKPRDLLVVGMGDSYASGEGNPDVKEGWFTTLFSFTGAKWLDKKCHRSLFSWQSLVAARLALEDRHRSVTFVSYACSGAETRHLFRNKYQGVLPKIKIKVNENTSNALDYQLTAVKRTLCSDNWDIAAGECKGSLRKPDLILLSTGGNDVGFGPLVAGSIMKDVTDDTSDEGKVVLDYRYTDRLDRDLSLISADLKQFAFQLYTAFGDEKKLPKTRVIQTLYPNPIMRDGKSGTFCGKGKDDFGYPVLRLAGKTGFLGWLMHVFGAVEEPKELETIHKDFIIPLTGTESEVPPKEEKARRGLRQLCIGLQCVDDNLTNTSLGFTELSIAAQDSSCHKYWKQSDGLPYFHGKKRWAMVMLRNEECRQEGGEVKCAFQKKGFITAAGSMCWAIPYVFKAQSMAYFIQTCMGTFIM